ncbi:MAG: hypothetical protein JWO91_400, partial [Acidobacteriaceae bacterium]|nr:hypothetical protein [Acidobacteriaceae bacterium]
MGDSAKPFAHILVRRLNSDENR